MKIVVATRNQGKLREFHRILGPLGWEVISQEEVCPGIEVTEDGETFAQNAYKKAYEIFRRTGLPTVADDSGLCVDALGGAPGIYSSRYAGEPHSDAACIQKLLQALGQLPAAERTAHFVAAICGVFGEDDMVSCQEACQGQIAFAPQGEDGFGYDPIFLVGDKSFAQMTMAQKDAISHRGKALRTFVQLLERRNNHCLHPKIGRN